jgi:hypothetical protein
MATEYLDKNSSTVRLPLHVSCFISAAARASPMLEVLPDGKTIRLSKSIKQDDLRMLATATQSHGSIPLSRAEWKFDVLFPHSASNSGASSSSFNSSMTTPAAIASAIASSSYSSDFARDFYREITQKALNHTQEGFNTNIIACGVHPTQKFRLLFGKSTTGIYDALSEPKEYSVNEKIEDIFEVYGQTGAILQEFYQKNGEGKDCRIGISSWIIVQNQVVDVLHSSLYPKSKTEVSMDVTTNSGGSSDDSGGGSNINGKLSFVSIEAPCFARALKILQIAKTNRIVMKKNTDNAHFFVRLAFYHEPTGLLSTLHLVDIIDFKSSPGSTDFHLEEKEESINDDYHEEKKMIIRKEEKEFFDIMEELSTILCPPSSSPRRLANNNGTGKTFRLLRQMKPKKMLLSNFLGPLLSANSRSFLYVNVIDARSNLKESLHFLETFYRAKQFTCNCMKLYQVDFEQLYFQVLPEDYNYQIQKKTMKKVKEVEKKASTNPTTMMSTNVTWLQEFTERKKKILGGNGPLETIEIPTVNSLLSIDQNHTNEQELELEDQKESNLEQEEQELERTYRALQQQEYETRQAQLASRIETTKTPLDGPEAPIALRTINGCGHTDNVFTSKAPVSFFSSSSCSFGLDSYLSGGEINLPINSSTFPPNVDGLDPITAQRIQSTDAALVRKNYDILLQLFRQETKKREEIENQNKELILEKEELQITLDLQKENFHLQKIEWKQKIRLLEQNTPFGALFDQYEKELDKTRQQLDKMREANVSLELRLANNNNNNNVPNELKKKFQQLCEENQLLEQQIAQLKKRERYVIDANIHYQSTNYY